MAELRLVRGWSDSELRQRLGDLEDLPRTTGPHAPEAWSEHHSEAVVAMEDVGEPEPDGPFTRGWRLVESYAFSDPRIVRGHFEPNAPLLHRRMLLEIRVLGLRYLNPVEVVEVQSHRDDNITTCGFRYDTLEGHLERGWEWFTLAKEHHTGAIRFRIHARWGAGDLPSWWTRVGFRLLAPRYQRAWHRLAHLRLRWLLGATQLAPLPPVEKILRRGPPHAHGTLLGMGPIGGHHTPTELSFERETIHPKETP